MKRSRTVLFAVILATGCCLAACGGSTEPPGSDQIVPDQTESDRAVPDQTESDESAIEPAINPGTDIFHGVLAYDIKELLGPEPFTADGIPDIMPVYENKYVADGAGVPRESVPIEEMRGIGEEIAAVLGLDIIEEEKKHNENHLGFHCGEIYIKVEGDESVYIDFGTVYPLPLKLENRNEDYLKALSYTAEVLEPLFTSYNINSSEVSLWHDYSFDGEKHYPYFANGFISEGKNKTSVLAGFHENYLSCIWIKTDPLSGDILGEYPTIPYAEAEELLLEGRYYSSMPLNDPIQQEQIAGAAIGYKTQVYDEVFLPFYIFYVDVTEREEWAMPENSKKLGLKMYSSYIVPAIEQEYLGQFPEIIVHFN